jgi:hypothetical protein
MPDNDAAGRWNREHPIGTLVLVKLANGASAQDRTASGAVPWGSVALVTLRGRPGMWITDMLEALPTPGEANR